MTKYVVLGVGNTLLTDAGGGVHVIDLREKSYALPPAVEIIDGDYQAGHYFQDMAPQ